MLLASSTSAKVRLALSGNLLRAVFRALAEGMSWSHVCAVFGIHRTTLPRWQAREQRGSLASARPPGAKRVLSPEDEAVLLAQLQEHPDATVDEHLRLWQEGSGVR